MTASVEGKAGSDGWVEFYGSGRGLKLVAVFAVRARGKGQCDSYLHLQV